VSSPTTFVVCCGLPANVVEAEEAFVVVLVEILQVCAGEGSPARKKRRGWLTKREAPEVVFTMLYNKVVQAGSTFDTSVQALVTQAPALRVEVSALHGECMRF
jgi:hypothetical protein